MKRILLASNDPACLKVVNEAFAPDCKVDAVVSKGQLQDKVSRKEYDFVMVDIGYLDIQPDKTVADYCKDLQCFWRNNPHAEIIVLTPPERIREAVFVVKAGAGNYLTYPLNKDELLFVMESLYESLKVQSELDHFRDEAMVGGLLRMSEMRSSAMRKVSEKVQLVAKSNATVLLSGETGTGKGVIARSIHSQSARTQGPFIGVHCGAIPETLIESELFGHEKGSFTGAVRRKLGKFELGAGGTVFLDEISTISPAMQIKLLQVLQDKVFQRVGGERDIRLEARIIAASNVDLKSLSVQGLFRTDLFYRLNVFPIEIPPLRERREDIPLLVEHFLRQLNKLHVKEIHGVHPSVLSVLDRYEWPGNVRELENIIERAFLLERSHVLTPESFPQEMLEGPGQGVTFSLDISQPLSEVRRLALDNVERSYLKALLTKNRGSIKQSASHIGITPRQMHNLMNRHGLRKEDFKSGLSAE
ncbi:DNA-binding transcriptional response regulator, NtrC family, contains REC, AAA-type ATPase, and a Fis-type DNA-binding domains [Desulfonatronum thiosulfatophilum]|uniref:DNA-binding transcriptional response regulator, NtrC family, contains REC, AAA-type ATPase, and a Fis-type DNA-binding domains n=1 Tax=Desulfonatronum thiosulfatophilum TaxID=617002 RepID=A0A1G6C2P5_9BACT|nr:sigma-54 dependent transcriptional regulator [Desulfonatronum thiosulfatophilum]SDB27141.1 DNA-binding transcriptional response regulator, NtrC family, contains REC, AAA-type ATPase, and a Fis-type DNA-binding domains [Desulfonatronum thiosulfatophilum]